MNRQALTVTLVALALIGGTTAYLATFPARQKLGRPGVRLVNEPVYAEGERQEGTNRIVIVSTNSVYLPPTVLDYTSEPVPLARIVWEWLPKDTTYGQRYYKAPDGFALNNNVVLMGRDRTSIHQPEYCVIGAGWTVVGKERTTVRVERPVPYDLPVTRMTTVRQWKDERGETRTVAGLYVYWFVAENEMTADHLKRMWRLAADMLRTGTLQRWAYVSCFATCPPGAEEATFARMKAFIAVSVPEFQLFPAAPSDPAGAPSPLAQSK